MTAENQNEEAAPARKGPRNLRIQGSVDDSNIVVGDQNTIHQGPIYHTTNIIGNIIGAVDTEQGQLQQLRRPLLKQMRTDVAQRLEDSLHNLIRVDLAQEEQRYQVGRRRKEMLVEATPPSSQAAHELIQRQLAVSVTDTRESIPPAEQTYTIFHRSDIGGRLLILGEPGAGKTTELLTISQRLVEEAIQDHDKPIPLIFELSSWTPNTPILAWLGQQLQKSYGVSKKLAEPLAQQWVQHSQILPMLDGLDELGQRNQVVCIEALEEFLAQHPALSVIVCCRREEYEQGEKQLQQLNGAIYLQAVGPQQIQRYLKNLGREQLWQGIQAEPELLKLAQSPLFLTMLVIAYQGKPIRDKSSLFNAYIHKQLHDPNHQGTYKPGKEKSPTQTLHYLGWLARQLTQRNETEFLIENLQPDWLATQQQQQTYQLIVRLFVGLIFGLSFGLMVGLMFGLMVGLMFGLAGGLLGTLSTRLQKIELQEKLTWSPRSGLILALIGGLFGGLLGGLLFGLVFELFDGLIHGLLFGLIFGLFGGLLGGLGNEAIEKKQVPNQGINKSLKTGLILGLSFGLTVGLFAGLSVGLNFGLIEGLMFGLSFGLTAGLMFGLNGAMQNRPIFGLSSELKGGLTAAFQHFILRIGLTKNGNTPWNYARFLEHTARHRFIQRTGGRYRFVHDLLRQHFAQMTPQQQTILAQKNKD